MESHYSITAKESIIFSQGLFLFSNNTFSAMNTTVKYSILPPHTSSCLDFFQERGLCEELWHEGNGLLDSSCDITGDKHGTHFMLISFFLE